MQEKQFKFGALYLFLGLAFTIFVLLWRFLFQSIQQSLSIDEKTLATKTNILDEKTIKKAVSLIGVLDQTPLATSSSSPTEKKSEVSLSNAKIEIINASGVAGAAKKLADIFPGNKNITYRTATSSDLAKFALDESQLIYQNDYKAFVPRLEKDLQSTGWKVVSSQKLSNDGFDITIVLKK